jgi:hypothetical protein
MPKTCYLHIGTPKTATSSIQNWLQTNGAALARNGIVYPGLERKQKFLLSMFIDNPLKGLRVHTDVGRSTREDVEAYHKEMLTAFDEQIAASGAANTVISDEALFLHARRIDWPGLRRFLEERFDRIVVVALVRAPLPAFLSRAQEQVKSGVRSYEDVCNAPYPLNLNSLETIFEAFGRETVILGKFEDAISRGIMTYFFDLIGLRHDLTEEERAVPPENEALSLEAALIMSELNKILPATRRFQDRHLRSRHLRDIGTTKFGLPRESVFKVRKTLEQQHEMLHRLGIDYGALDLDNLPPATPDWGPDTLKAIALAFNELAGREKG